ncbi:MAG: NIL domain-containing protein [Desulfohalobiaceae bacterium]
MTEPMKKENRAIIALTFPPLVSGRPVMCDLAKRYDLAFNILKARITPRREGHMVVEISGPVQDYKDGVSFLKEHGIVVAKVSQQIWRDEESCLHCGLCTAMCATRALRLEPDTRRVTFDPECCSACGMCTRICPVHAMNVDVDESLW